MNGRNIPGYYYDEDKKKYFRIQANHLVPQSAKYAKGNVQLEERQAKKRKTENRRHEIRLKQTVKRSAILQHPIVGGTGLFREHGTGATSAYLDQSDAAMISRWRPRRTTIKFQGWSSYDVRIEDAHYIPSTQQMIMAAVYAPYGQDSSRVLYSFQYDGRATHCSVSHDSGIVAFNSHITSIQTTTHCGVRRVLCCASQSSLYGGNVFMGWIPSPGSTSVGLTPDVRLSFGHNDNHLTSSSVHPVTGKAAILGTSGVCITTTDADLYVTSSFPLENEDHTPGIAWLDVNTVAFNSGTPSDTGKHSVTLWDVRTRHGTSTRFERPCRITGVANPSANLSDTLRNSHQLLVATNKRLNLFDTRMPRFKSGDDYPLISLPHVHQGPELQYASNGLDLVAAVDRDNIVQVYSTRSGKSVGPLAMSESKQGKREDHPIKRLMWYEDDTSGSILQACSGNAVVRWTWGASETDDEA
ncbi:hypothetical protein LTR37_018938 [Vermiconidia calcicola]|uniref:Uncharacterized protein n=1 Tax=Vermiconidia calcicola TaxID=1690605 RepID=A0ACC3MFI4_9PEZI|nr:hypothetical protein LTR37_018938 [Vermiconidia calcicola]